MYDHDDLQVVLDKISAKEILDERTFDVFVRNQEQVLSELKVAFLTLKVFLEHLKVLRFNFNGCFDQQPLAIIMMRFEKYVNCETFELLLDDYGTDLKTKEYQKIIKYCSTKGFRHEGWYDILSLFCQHSFMDKHTDLMIFGDDFDPEPRTINILLNHDKNHQIMHLLNKNKQQKQRLKIEFRHVYNLIF